jgi:hypothetical protein
MIRVILQLETAKGRLCPPHGVKISIFRTVLELISSELHLSMMFGNIADLLL